MAFLRWLSSNARTPTPGSLVARLLNPTRPHPDTFVAGVLHPDAPGSASRRWRYRRIWVDPLRPDDVITVRHGDQTMTVRLEHDPLADPPGPEPRSGLVVLSGRLVPEAVAICFAVPPGEIGRFGCADL